MGASVCKNVSEKENSNIEINNKNTKKVNFDLDKNIIQDFEKNEKINEKNKRVSFAIEENESDKIQKHSSVVVKPQFKRMMTIKKDDIQGATFLLSAQKKCGYKIYIDELLELLP